ncbi:ABC transporter ATP-binding protein [Paracoccus sp. S4493]|uniref:ABC transporter ATP-binding protein n=1 Tax=Paracoccus TaxID=265 RepID=UPI0005FA6FD5|nr:MULTISPECIES: ABC transporter ATP-binding protein [Paracoccus]TYP68501.1 ABC-2 type transport system ATP-binding protein [Stutzerimonas stutzeri]AZY92606.1 ATP-binding cassette domain-containing protein [Paracoccus sp. Arc7-R13]KJZ31852.1 ABC transporter ATP-binding protein [Paracoccus sp. S4493]MBF5079109.1 ATP-binding cassette domain-containing protein [Paracoccus sp. NBH48]QXI62375.1 ABC transporter ATP-binding protein NatA [Paracoccus marcusii]
MTAALQIDHVSHNFGAVQALDDVSLTVPRGGFTALLGVNGAGKTTLFSLVTRLYNNRSGMIRVAGHDLRREPSQALARLGVVFQSRAMDADLTIRQNLIYHASLHGIPGRLARPRIDQVLGQVDLADKADTRVTALSGGQSRRAEIARALIHSPDLLLLDEATVGLDVKSRAEVLALTRRLIARDGVSALWATHIMDEIDPADDLVILHRGRVLRQGRAADIAGPHGLTRAFLDLTGVAP